MWPAVAVLEFPLAAVRRIQELKNTLPKCKITWDGGTIEPK
jgi:hypothetical protein